MSKTILIDSSSDEEIRVAVTENGKLDDFEIEDEKKNASKGDVYLAKITRVEPSLQAAFVDFGANRHGFLPLTEIHPDYFKIPSSDQQALKKLSSEVQNDKDIDDINGSNDANDNKKQGGKEEEGFYSNQNNGKKEYLNFFKKYKIQDVIKPRQVILVQINKEERGLKGAALSTYLSFAGRYCVLMPNSLNNDGISRKIADLEERKKLKKILESVNTPEKMSVIVRTAGIGKTKKEIIKDLEFLTNQWNKIRELTLKSAAPTIIYEEGSIIKRTVRDLLTNDVNEILIEGKKGYEVAKKYTRSLVPQKAKNVKLYKNKDLTLFNNNNIEQQIHDLFNLKVNLVSGGSLVINTTEALVAIDVNSGKNTTERNIENTALKTNLEAANEIARQLRLRDLGGLVVIDFIDMDDYRNNFKVEKAIKNALYRDRARVQVGRISMLGLLELSRQRLRSSLIERFYNKCLYCNGSGIVLNSNSNGEQIIKLLKEKLINTKNLKVTIKCNSSLAELLLNNKRKEIDNLEISYSAKINFIFNSHLPINDPIIEIIEKNNITPEKNQKITQKNKVNKKIAKKIAKKTIKKTKKISKNKDIKKITLDEKEGSELEKSGWWSE